MKYDCEICRGAGRVRLPVYRSLTVAHFDANAASDFDTREASREYPCPECGDSVSLGKIHAGKSETFASSQIEDPQYLDRVRGGLARALADQLLEKGFIRFQRGPIDDRNCRFGMVATVAVAQQGALDTLEQRIAERQEAVGVQVADEAARQIDNWGSYYGHSEILKRDARRLIGEALKTVLHKFSGTARQSS
jgi:hypothetical protein